MTSGAEWNPSVRAIEGHLKIYVVGDGIDEGWSFQITDITHPAGLPGGNFNIAADALRNLEESRPVNGQSPDGNSLTLTREAGEVAVEWNRPTEADGPVEFHVPYEELSERMRAIHPDA